MSADQVRYERRPMQRFSLHLPLSVRLAGSANESSGYTQDLSARGILFFTDLSLTVGDEVEFTCIMPSVITLADTMRVRCRGTVVRIVPPSGGSARGVAVRIAGYEFLADMGSENRKPVSFPRLSPAISTSQKTALPENLQSVPALR